MYRPKRPTPTSPPAPTRVQNFTIGETADRYSRRARMYILINTIRPTTIQVHQREVNCWKNGWSGGFCGSGGVKTLSSAMFMNAVCRMILTDPGRDLRWVTAGRGAVAPSAYSLHVGVLGARARDVGGRVNRRVPVDAPRVETPRRNLLPADAYSSPRLRTGGSATSRCRPRTAGCATGRSSERLPVQPGSVIDRDCGHSRSG